MKNTFLPVNKKDMFALGWDRPDIVYITGDAYVDHPSFGASIITRVLQAKGFKVAVLSQPDWKSTADFEQFGKPRLAYFITSGNIDSMVAHYTVAKRPRSQDAYTAGGAMGKRPDRAVIVYSNIVKRLFPDVPVVIGGLEASLRRFAHYDYWDDSVRPSILLDSKADLLIYGMGENQSIQIAERLASGEKIDTMHDIKGTVYSVDVRETPYVGVECPSFENVSSSKKEYAKAARVQQDEQDHIRGKVIKQKHGKKMVVQNQPMPPLTTPELDWVYSLPYARAYHPMYESMGGVPGIQEVEFSITHNRGCFGACNFCSIQFHQGRYITTRSKKSIMAEAEKLTHLPNFKGYIHDIGGPTANFRRTSCDFQLEHGLCKGKKCLAPKPCPNLAVDHSEYLDILRSVRELPGVKKVFIRSGIRYDYLLEDKDDSFFRELVEHHVSGQLKVAPEHCSAAVLDKMGKPHIESYKRFCKMFYDFTGKENKDQYVVPYLMSSHPGSTLSDAVELALFCKHENIHPKQVQDFYPTPGTISTSMFYTELDPYTLKEVYVPKSENEKAMQRALLQYFIPENKPLVIKALIKAGRRDLIGNDKKCLVTPMAGQTQGGYSKQNNNRNSHNQKGRGKNGKDKFAKYRRKNKKK